MVQKKEEEGDDDDDDDDDDDLGGSKGIKLYWGWNRLKNAYLNRKRNCVCLYIFFFGGGMWR